MYLTISDSSRIMWRIFPRFYKNWIFLREFQIIVCLIHCICLKKCYFRCRLNNNIWRKMTVTWWMLVEASMLACLTAIFIEVHFLYRNLLLPMTWCVFFATTSFSLHSATRSRRCPTVLLVSNEKGPHCPQGKECSIPVLFINHIKYKRVIYK